MLTKNSSAEYHLEMKELWKVKLDQVLMDTAWKDIEMLVFTLSSTMNSIR